jgi:hypothetical protein
MERTLPTHTGSSIVSEYTRRHRTNAFYIITMIYFLGISHVGRGG